MTAVARPDLEPPPPWELRRPDAVLRRVARDLPFDRPRALLAAVQGRGADQRVTASSVLWASPPLDPHERTALTEAAVGRLGLGSDWSPDAEVPIIVGIVVRPGLAVWSWDEEEVFLGLRYGMNGCRAFQAGPLVVTSLGWWDALDDLAGSSPRAVWRRAVG